MLSDERIYELVRFAIASIGTAHNSVSLPITQSQAIKSAIRTAIAEQAEQIAKLCETLPLTLDANKYPSMEERHLIAVVESGCRGAFAAAIRAQGKGKGAE